MTPARWRNLTLYLGFWTLLGILSAAETYMSQQLMDHPISWHLAFRRAFEEWYLWAFVALGVIWIANRLRLESGRGRWLLSHAAVGAAFSILYVVFYSWLLQGQRSIDGTIFTFHGVFHKVIVHYFVLDMIIYWMVVLAHHGWVYYAQYREREMLAADLQRQLIEAKLEALRMQLNPHFLFNTLHTISALIHENPERADRTIARLSELLRLSLDQSDAHKIPLRQELAFLDRYLDIEQTRFEDRLEVQREVPPELENALVPSLILQPLVENAIRHGIEPREDTGRILIRAVRDNGTLKLSVSDNGSGLSESENAREGIGLSNTRSRLQHLYGQLQHLELKRSPAGGLEVRITIPFQEEE